MCTFDICLVYLSVCLFLSFARARSLTLNRCVNFQIDSVAHAVYRAHTRFMVATSLKYVSFRGSKEGEFNENIEHNYDFIVIQSNSIPIDCVLSANSFLFLLRAFTPTNLSEFLCLCGGKDGNGVFDEMERTACRNTSYTHTRSHGMAWSHTVHQHTSIKFCLTHAKVSHYSMRSSTRCAVAKYMC